MRIVLNTKVSTQIGNLGAWGLRSSAEWPKVEGMTNTTETRTARDIDAELLALHGATIERGYGWRTASMPDQTMRIEVITANGEHHMTTRMYARRRAAYLGYTVGKFLKLTYVRGPDGLQQRRRVYELSYGNGWPTFPHST